MDYIALACVGYTWIYGGPPPFHLNPGFAAKDSVGRSAGRRDPLPVLKMGRHIVTAKSRPSLVKQLQGANFAVITPSFSFSCDAKIRNPAKYHCVTSLAAPRQSTGHLDFVQMIAAEVPAELPFVRFHVAKLFVSTLLLRLGLDADQVARFLPEADLRDLSLEYSTLLDGDRLGGWFLSALDRHEPEARSFLQDYGIHLPPSEVTA